MILELRSFLQRFLRPNHTKGPLRPNFGALGRSFWLSAQFSPKFGLQLLRFANKMTTTPTFGLFLGFGGEGATTWCTTFKTGRSLLFFKITGNGAYFGLFFVLKVRGRMHLRPSVQARSRGKLGAFLSCKRTDQTLHDCMQNGVYCCNF